MEKNEVVVVLDAAYDGSSIGPEAFCCSVTFGFFRG